MLFLKLYWGAKVKKERKKKTSLTYIRPRMMSEQVTKETKQNDNNTYKSTMTINSY